MSYYDEKRCKELKEYESAFDIDTPVCTPTIYTFLAETTVKPCGIEKPEKTAVEKREIELGLVECLHYPILWDLPLFGDEEEIPLHEKLNRVNKHLEFLYKQRELLENDENKKEDLQKLEREIKHFLRQKGSVLYALQKEMTSLDNISDIPSPENFWQNMKEEIEGQRENLDYKSLKKSPINDDKKMSIEGNLG